MIRSSDVFIILLCLAVIALLPSVPAFFIGELPW